MPVSLSSLPLHLRHLHRVALVALIIGATAACDSGLVSSETISQARISDVFSVGHMSRDAIPNSEVQMTPLPLFGFLSPNQQQSQGSDRICVLPPLDQDGTLFVRVIGSGFVVSTPGGCAATTQTCGQVQVTGTTSDGVTFAAVGDRDLVALAVGDYRGELTLRVDLVLENGSFTCADDVCSVVVELDNDCDLEEQVLSAPSRQASRLPVANDSNRDSGVAVVEEANAGDAGTQNAGSGDTARTADAGGLLPADASDRDGSL